MSAGAKEDFKIYHPSIKRTISIKQPEIVKTIKIGGGFKEIKIIDHKKNYLEGPLLKRRSR